MPIIRSTGSIVSEYGALSPKHVAGFVFIDALLFHTICVSILLFANDHKLGAPNEKVNI
jgi:hypothetical protein